MKRLIAPVEHQKIDSLVLWGRRHAMNLVLWLGGWVGGGVAVMSADGWSEIYGGCEYGNVFRPSYEVVNGVHVPVSPRA